MRGQQGRGKRVEVGPGVGVTFQLLGRGVFVFPREFVADDGLRPRRRVLGDAEVDDRRPPGVAAAQDDVVGRQVAMHHAERMGRHQPLEHAVRHDHQFAVVDAPVHHQVVQRRALDVVHDEKDVALVRARTLDIAHHRVVHDVAHHVLALHQLDIVGIAREPGVQRLDRDAAVVDLVLRQIHLARAAAPEASDDLVGVVEDLPHGKDVGRQGLHHAGKLRRGAALSGRPISNGLRNGKKRDTV